MKINFFYFFIQKYQCRINLIKLPNFFVFLHLLRNPSEINNKIVLHNRTKGVDCKYKSDLLRCIFICHHFIARCLIVITFFVSFFFFALALFFYSLQRSRMNQKYTHMQKMKPQAAVKNKTMSYEIEAYFPLALGFNYFTKSPITSLFKLKLLPFVHLARGVKDFCKAQLLPFVRTFSLVFEKVLNIFYRSIFFFFFL